MIFGSFFAPKAQNWTQKPHFEGISGLLKDFEFYIRILHKKIDKNGKFHRNWKNLIFGSFFAPKAQNWAQKPHFEGISGVFKDFEFHIRILHKKLDKNGKFHRN